MLVDINQMVRLTLDKRLKRIFGSVTFGKTFFFFNKKGIVTYEPLHRGRLAGTVNSIQYSWFLGEQVMSQGPL